jgi:hypothetical protein
MGRLRSNNRSNRSLSIDEVLQHDIGSVLPQRFGIPVAGRDGHGARPTGFATRDIARGIADDNHIVESSESCSTLRASDRHQLITIVMVRAERSDVEVEPFGETGGAQLQLGGRTQITGQERLDRAGRVKRIEYRMHTRQYLQTGTQIFIGILDKHSIMRVKTRQSLKRGRLIYIMQCQDFESNLAIGLTAIFDSRGGGVELIDLDQRTIEGAQSNRAPDEQCAIDVPEDQCLHALRLFS